MKSIFPPYNRRLPTAFFLPLLLAFLLTPLPHSNASDFNGGNHTLIAWNDLGMHCMDDDYSIFSLLPPFNTINAQLIAPNGDLVTSGSGVTLTYEAVADLDGSVNTTALGKTNFWDHSAALYAAPLAVDQGLFGYNMPGAANTPQSMDFEAAHEWWIAAGVPLPPVDNAGHYNSYPMMKVVARNSSTGAELASTEIVLPVSSEMDCRACHASGSPAPAGALPPISGWENDPATNPNLDPVRDYRLNVLRIHDDKHLGEDLYQTALAARGYSAAGLYATATDAVNPTPVLCATCHKSNALPVDGVTGVSDLTHALHTLHAGVTNPQDGLPMDSSLTRSSCYQCHPGSETRCLRGAMGAAVAPDGSLAMDCQSCHGNMSDVGSHTRAGWFQEPNCQSCHTGTATDNYEGQIRYTSVWTAAGIERVPSNTTFATNPDTPAAGVSLYRFSSGHGGLQCSACHGSTHAVYPSSHRNDNIQSLSLQGHVGTVADCGACHAGTFEDEDWNKGPHGMHPITEKWAGSHGDPGKNTANCATCHGSDLKGTVLSRALGDRSFTVDKFGTKNFWRGQTIGCYSCHDGPDNSDDPPSAAPPSVSDYAIATPTGAPGAVTLAATNGPVTFRVVNQPAYGQVAVSGNTATYFPYAGFSGYDSFTFAATNSIADSNLGAVSVTVGNPTLASVADTDADGLSDLLEYALGLSPFFPSSTGPRLELVEDPATGASHWTATLTRCCPPPDASVAVEVSSDLNLWESGPDHTTVVEDGMTSLIIRDQTDTSAAPRRFMRIKASR